MNDRKRILAAIDLGSDTEKILAYAVWLARKTGDNPEILMLHVMDYALTPPAYIMPYMEKEKEASEEELRRWADRLKGLGTDAAFKIATGRLVETFNKTFEELGISAMVIGYKSHIIRPSSSERLIKSLVMPMLVVRGQKSEGKALASVNIKNILCAVDFSDNSRKALELARSLSEAVSSPLIVANVVSSLKMEESLKRLKDMSETDKHNYRKHIIREAEEKICSFLHVCSGAESVVRIGIPYKTINEIAVERDADLIVMGARGLSYTKGVILGSVSESIVKSSPCPVMIVH
ncbi:MAG: universal stress protein [Nitrospirae bacterium]|nr:universal stress protein [Nitrospirota bacterium]